jgi:hypothetical protein
MRQVGSQQLYSWLRFSSSLDVLGHNVKSDDIQGIAGRLDKEDRKGVSKGLVNLIWIDDTTRKARI